MSTEPAIEAPIVVRATIVNQKGLHARAAAKFVKTADRFDARIEVTRDDLTVGGTSILGLMMLAAGIGSEIEMRATGPEAEIAIQTLADLVGRGFDE